MATELIIATADLALKVNGYVQRADNLLEQAKRAEINDLESFGKAQTFVGIAAAVVANLEEERKQLIEPFDKRVRFVNAQYKAPRDKLNEALDTVKVKAQSFERTERSRLVREQQAQQRAAEDEALSVAAEREAAGDAAGADAIVEMASSVQLPKAKVVIPRDEITGTKFKTRRVWEGRVGDVKAMCAAIAAGELPEDIVEFKKSRLNEIAKEWAAARTDMSILEINRHGLAAEEVDSLTR
jgi:hypothetical protein